jgi:hypothetical protein
MIIIGLKGGIGNQLFQYAFGRHLALLNNTELKFDTEGLRRANDIGNIYRDFALPAFNIPIAEADRADIIRLKYPLGPLSKAWRLFRGKVLNEYHIKYHERLLAIRGEYYGDGYYQSPRYFDAIRPTLLTDLTLKNPLSPGAATIATHIAGATAVSLHVRRGDYATNPRVIYEYGTCSVAYYRAAMKHVETAAGKPVTYFVFSDDIAWVKENLPVGADTVFIDDPTISDVESMMLMSQCTHNIIANSSFSWWGAWLNQHLEKLVVAPTPWFEHQPTDPDLIPVDWVRIAKV